MDTTQAIVLKKIQYNDNSIIVKCFTQKYGVKSYLVKGAYKPKSKLSIAYFQPLHILEICSKHKANQNLHYFNTVQMHIVYQNIPNDIAKQSMLFFLTEVLWQCLKDDGNSNFLLYDYLKNALQWLDLHQKIDNFHLVFLLNLSKYLGFYPNVSKGCYFNLQSGCFQNEPVGKYVLEGESLERFTKIFDSNFENMQKIAYNAQQRNEILEHLILYFRLHLANFTKPKSLSVLQTLLA